jgi:hypothetical protein
LGSGAVEGQKFGSGAREARRCCTLLQVADVTAMLRLHLLPSFQLFIQSIPVGHVSLFSILLKLPVQEHVDSPAMCFSFTTSLYIRRFSILNATLVIMCEIKHNIFLTKKVHHFLF